MPQGCVPGNYAYLIWSSLAKEIRASACVWAVFLSAIFPIGSYGDAASEISNRTLLSSCIIEASKAMSKTTSDHSNTAYCE